MAALPEASHTLVRIGITLDAVRAARSGLAELQAKLDATDALWANRESVPLERDVRLLDALLDSAETAALELRRGALARADLFLALEASLHAFDIDLGSLNAGNQAAVLRARASAILHARAIVSGGA